MTGKEIFSEFALDLLILVTVIGLVIGGLIGSAIYKVTAKRGRR